MSVLRRIVLLGLVSISGLALLAPLAARSAAELPVPRIAHLLPEVAPPDPDVDRGGLLTGRSVVDGADGSAASGSAEALATAPDPTPGSVTMEVTLVAVATPEPSPVPTADPAPQLPPVTYDGDTVWDALAKCESGGNWSINTGNGYYGGLQFALGTWQGYGGGEFAEYPHEATREEQITVAERLHAARGFQPWPACSAKLGLS